MTRSSQDGKGSIHFKQDGEPNKTKTPPIFASTPRGKKSETREDAGVDDRMVRWARSQSGATQKSGERKKRNESSIELKKKCKILYHISDSRRAVKKLVRTIPAADSCHSKMQKKKPTGKR